MRATTVLVVDDDPDISRALAALLEMEGYAVSLARNGQEALHMVEETPPALVLLDLWMPILDGRGFLADFRARGWTTPVVLMSAALGLKQSAAQLPVQDYIAKPFDFRRLLEVIERLLSLHEGERRRAA